MLKNKWHSASPKVAATQRRYTMKNLSKAILAIMLAAAIFPGLSATGFAADAKVIKIGYTAPFTGAAAEFGTNGWRGVLLALEDINKKMIMIGGEPHKIQIVKFDSVCNPDTGVANVHKLVTEEKVVAILGDHCSTVCSVIAPLCDQYKIPGITIECAVDSVTKPGHEFYFRMRPPVSLMVPLFMPKIFKTFDPRTAGFLVINDGYGHLFTQSIMNELDWRDVKTVVKETFERGSTDFKSQLTKIKESKADLLFYVGTASEGAGILKQARELGLMPRTQFIGSEEMGEMELLLRAGAEAVDGTYAVSLWGDIPPEFEQRVKKNFNKPMHYAIIFGYDALHVLAKAIEDAQSVDPVKIKDAMKKIDYKALEGRIRFKDFDGYKNQGKFTPSMIRWHNGKRVHLDIFLTWE
jgi:branched-chain amino acid transport system substrate-binding protein